MSHLKLKELVRVLPQWARVFAYNSEEDCVVNSTVDKLNDREFLSGGLYEEEGEQTVSFVSMAVDEELGNAFVIFVYDEEDEEEEKFCTGCGRCSCADSN